jgi:hypothetical protein
MTNQEYAALGAPGYNHFDGWQYLNIANPSSLEHMRIGYTPVAIDLVDSRNQRAENWGNTAFADDRVSGFTLQEVESTLAGTRSLDDWKGKLKAFNRVPAQDLDILFDFYRDL